MYSRSRQSSFFFFFITTIRTDCSGSPDSLKKKLAKWGLIVKLNDNDAADMTAAQAELDARGSKSILLLRGRVETIKRVREYQRRRSKARFGQSSIPNHSRRSNVISVSLPPLMRPGPALHILSNFETLLREQQALIYAANEKGWCTALDTNIIWTAAHAEMKTLERRFEQCIRESTGAFEEGRLEWAVLCWKSALLQLEDLVLQLDLNLWTTFIRCCLRLVRFGAPEVGHLLMQKLCFLREQIPFTSPHRCFIYALTDLPLTELVAGGVFFLEAKLRVTQAAWPDNPEAHVTSRLNLAEERFYQGCEDPGVELSEHHLPELSLNEDMSRYIRVSSSIISRSMLLFDFSEAESHLKRCIAEIDMLATHGTASEAYAAALATYYVMLGAAQYYQEHKSEARESYAKALEIHENYLDLHNTPILDLPQLHRVLTLLEWLSKAENDCTDSQTGTSYRGRQAELEKGFLIMLELRSNEPLELRPELARLTRSISSKRKRPVVTQAKSLDQVQGLQPHNCASTQKSLTHQPKSNDELVFSDINAEKRRGHQVNTRAASYAKRGPSARDVTIDRPSFISVDVETYGCLGPDSNSDLLAKRNVSAQDAKAAEKGAKSAWKSRRRMQAALYSDGPRAPRPTTPWS